MVICPYCGAQIEDSAKYCNFCGAKIDPVPAAPSEPVTQQTPAPAPEQAEQQPVYAQPIYAAPKKKSKKWLIPVIALLLVAAIGVGFLVTRGNPNDPNLGTYKATTVSMYGLDLNPDDIFEGGFTVELKGNGICWIKAGDEQGPGTWEIEDGVITIDDGNSEIEGKIEDGVITIENMLDMGLNLQMVKLEE